MAIKARLKLGGKEIEIRDIEHCRGIKRLLGLMFKTGDANALLFEFPEKTKRAIHSLLCPDFLAVWMLDDKIIDYKLVRKNRFHIKPRKEFTKLLEIPVGGKYLNRISICNFDEVSKI